MAGVVITSVVVPPLLTFNDVCVSSIKNIISVESYQTGLSLSLKGRRDCLNHQPFALTLNINALAITNIGIKIFIGPHIDGVYDICDYTCKHWHKFVECDHFAVTRKYYYLYIILFRYYGKLYLQDQSYVTRAIRKY